jgi:pimeloyl-ACP methyl ester carboxylesterase
LALLVSACADDSAGNETTDNAEDADDQAAESDGDGSNGPATIAAPEVFDGQTDAFYQVPDPLPTGEPGDVLRVQEIDAPDGQAGWRIMYLSTDGGGNPRAVTGLLFVPEGDAPDDGWPLLAWAHGTTGIAPQCAPSRGGAPPPAFGVEGVHVMTDYIGLGPEGELHPYISAAGEANAVVDSVQAAHNLTATPDVVDATIADQWVLAGHSQGGHAALAAHEVAPDRLPEHELLGTVAIAPGSMLTEVYGDEVQTRIISTMIMFGAAANDPDLVDPAEYLAPDAHAAAETAVVDHCIDGIIGAMVPYAGGEDFYLRDVYEEGSSTRAWLEDNEPLTTATEAPLLIVQGGQDPIVMPARTDALVERLCDIGQVLQVAEHADADHGTILGAEEIAPFLQARLAGDPPTDECA